MAMGNARDLVVYIQLHRSYMDLFLLECIDKVEFTELTTMNPKEYSINTSIWAFIFKSMMIRKLTFCTLQFHHNFKEFLVLGKQFS